MIQLLMQLFNQDIFIGHPFNPCPLKKTKKIFVSILHHESTIHFYDTATINNLRTQMQQPNLRAHGATIYGT